MSLIKANAVQVGQSPTATQNFTLAVPSSPDGTIKLARGNAGATTQDVLNVSNAGVVSFPQGLGNISTGTALATGSTAARSLADRFGDVVNVKDFGLIGDGVTNNYSNFLAAKTAANGKKLYFPAGHYVILLPDATTMGGFGSNTTILGDGSSSFIDIRTTTNTYLNAFNIGNVNNILFENLKIKFSVLPTQVASLFFLSGISSGIKFVNCDLFSSYDQVNTDHLTYLFNLSSSALSEVSNFELNGCAIHNFLYPLLKINAATSTHKYWKFINNKFYENDEGLGFNTPNGIYSEIIIENNLFETPRRADSGLVAHLGFASAKNVIIANNIFTGVTAGEAIHIEEDAVRYTITGNVIEIGELTDQFVWGDGIRLLDNNIAGPRTAPSNITITGNTIKRTGSTGGVGIAFQYDIAGPNTEHTVCTANVIEGFDIGILVDSFSNTIRISENLIQSCNKGILMPISSYPQIANNTLVSCLEGYNGSGLVGDGHFISCANPISKFPANSVISTNGWSTQVSGITVAATPTTTAIPIFKVGTRFNGELSINIGTFNNAWSGKLLVDYDGATLTSSMQTQFASSTIQFSSLSIAGSDIVFTASNSGAAVTDVILRASFYGVHIFN
jgi:parallel beta-helix repeat protein